MSCGHCVDTLTQALQAMVGVRAVSISLEENLARITYDTEKLGLPEVKKVVEDLGYVVRAMA